MSFSPDYPLDHVKQIEIIRGPGSALYGANAFVGLINIITDESQQEGGLIDLRGGTGDGEMASASYGKNMGGDTHFSLGIDYRGQYLEGIPVQPFTMFESDNPPPFPIGIPFNSVFSDRVTADHTVGWNLAATLKVGAFSMRFDYERQDAENNWGSGVPSEPVTDSFGTYDLTDGIYRNTVETDVYRFNLSYSHDINDRLSLRPTLTCADFDMDRFFSYVNLAQADILAAGEGLEAGLFEPRSARTLNADVSLEWRPTDTQFMVAGYSFQSDEVDESLNLDNRGPTADGVITQLGPPMPSGAFLSEGDRKVHALFAQHTWQVNQHFGMTAGVRGDDYNDFPGRSRKKTHLCSAK